MTHPPHAGEHYHHLIMRNDAFWVRVVSDPRLVSLAAGVADFLQVCCRRGGVGGGARCAPRTLLPPHARLHHAAAAATREDD
jgi:hypothetical protein